MISGLTESIPLQPVVTRLTQDRQVELWLFRLDLVHPKISGNKWFKLKYNLIEAQRLGYRQLVSFGGAYSNHIHALSWAGKESNLKTTGIIRGEAVYPLNPTLADAVEWGMQLEWVDRETWRRKDSKEFIDLLHHKFGDFYLIPEGGSNGLAIKGSREIPSHIPVEYDYLCSACGTGGTLAGLISGAPDNTQVLGFLVLKSPESFKPVINTFLPDNYQTNWELFEQFHCGGYARIRPDLIQFIDLFEETFQIPLDPVYTGKMLYGLFTLIAAGYFPQGSRIVAIHTGGLQGRRGMADKIQGIRCNNHIKSEGQKYSGKNYKPESFF